MKKILVIEDDEYIRTNLVEILDIEGFQTFDAENGKIGLQKALDNKPDLILCDIMMPELDGHGVLKRVRQEPVISAIPFIFLTAKASKNDMRQGMESGANDYLTKPFTRNELLKAITTQLDNKSVIDDYAQKQLMELRSNISYALPHELLTPLNGIIGSSDMLKENFDAFEKDEIIELAGMINTSAVRLYRLIQNFLLYSRLEIVAADHSAIAALKVETSYSLLSSLHEVIERLTDDKEQFQDIIFKDSIDTSVNISGVYLDKILEEVIGNALKFSESGTPIAISTGVDESTVKIEISDKGRGMSAEEISNLGAYMQFGRKKHEQQGSGLGLMIVKRLVQLHNGKWNVESKIGEGTTVTIYLPVGKEEDF